MPEDWKPHRLDYKVWEPEIVTNEKLGMRYLSFYDVNYRATMRLYWPVPPKKRITIEEVTDYFKQEFKCKVKVRPTTGAFHKRLIYTPNEDRVKEGNIPEESEVEIIVLFEWTLDAGNNAYLVSNLIHEIGHCVFSVLKRRGLKHREGSEEAYTYLLSYYTHIILDALLDPFQAFPEDYAI